MIAPFVQVYGPWITVAAAACTIIGFLWRIVHRVGEVLTTVRQLDEVAPVILEIAEEFKSDSGSTLKDKIDAIELMAQRAEQNSALALAATKLQDQVLAGICAKLSPKVGRAKR